MLTYNTLLVLFGAALLGALCGVVGSFAVLRRRALLGDALAHAALPGIAIIFWITQTRSLPILLLGALATGVFGVWSLAIMRRHTRTKEDAALALVLSVLFGAGIALSRYVQSAVPGGGKAGLDSYILGKTAGIVLSDVILVSIVCLFALAIVILLFKEFRVVTFDADFARSLGWNTTALDFFIMSLVAISVVVGLPMVGIVMVAALTILPAVSARFWVEDLRKMLVLSAALGVASALIGVLVSAQFSQMPTGPMVIITAGFGFVASSLLAPNRGLVAFVLRARAHQVLLGARIALEEASRSPLSDASVRLKQAGVRRTRASVAKAIDLGWLRQSELGYVPTESGSREVSA